MSGEEATRAMREGIHVKVTNAGKTYIGIVVSISEERVLGKFLFRGKSLGGEEEISIFVEADALSFHTD